MFDHYRHRALLVSVKILFLSSLAGCGIFAVTAARAQGLVQSSYSTSSGTSTGFNVQAGRASDFVDSEGVNTHFSYTDTAYYQQPAALIAKIQALHIRHIRDGLAYSWVPPNLYAIYSELASAGIYADLVMPNPSAAGPSSNSIEGLLAHYPAVDAVEGPNEYDLAGNGQWASTLRNYLPTIWTVGQHLGIPVIGPALTQTSSYPALGNVSDDINYGNYHAYWGGRNPETTGWGGSDSKGNYYGSLPYDLDELAIDGPGRPPVITESGYVVNNTPSVNIIPEYVEAVYEPRLLLHCWNMGIKRTYIYELMDEPSSTTGFGLLRADLSPRPAYRAMATLNSLLADTSDSFTPRPLTYWLSGNTAGIETTLLQKHDGSFWLAIWENSSIFDVNAVQSITVPHQTVTLSVSQGLSIKGLWTLNIDGSSSAVAANNATVSFSVSPRVTLVEIAK